MSGEAAACCCGSVSIDKLENITLCLPEHHNTASPCRCVDKKLGEPSVKPNICFVPGALRHLAKELLTSNSEFLGDCRYCRRSMEHDVRVPCVVFFGAEFASEKGGKRPARRFLRD